MIATFALSVEKISLKMKHDNFEMFGIFEIPTFGYQIFTVAAILVDGISNFSHASQLRLNGLWHVGYSLQMFEKLIEAFTIGHISERT